MKPSHAIPHSTRIHTAHWTRQTAAQITALPANTFPPFDVGKLRPLMPGHHVWDSWFVMTEQGGLANVQGFRILIALTRPIAASSGEGEKIAWFASKDGVHYRYGGLLFEESLYADARECSGSTILRADGRLQTFYTLATGACIDGVWQTAQRFATAIQSVELVGQGLAQHLEISAPTYHALLAEPDGVLYENVPQSSAREAMYPTRHRR